MHGGNAVIDWHLKLLANGSESQSSKPQPPSGSALQRHFLVFLNALSGLQAGTEPGLRELLPRKYMRRRSMKTFIATIAAAFLAASFTMPADAANSKKKNTVSASKAAACKAEAKKKYSAIHLLKRRAHEKKCMGQA
jgi:hypothetical protein